jgi:hypothetical protein
MKVVITTKFIGDVPKRQPEMLKCVFDKNVPASYINSIRRVIIDNDIPVKYLTVKDTDIETSDEQIIPDYLIKNIEMLPIDQGIPMSTKYAIKVDNKLDKLIDIYSQILDPTEKYFDDCMIFISLSPKRFLEVKNIHVAIGRWNARYSLAGQIFAGLDFMTDENCLCFTTLGSMPARDVLKLAIDTLIKKISGVSSVLSDIRTLETDSVPYHELIIPNETATVSMPIVKTLLALQGKDIDAVSFDSIEQTMTTIKFNSTEDPRSLLEDSIKYLLKFYQELNAAI